VLRLGLGLVLRHKRKTRENVYSPQRRTALCQHDGILGRRPGLLTLCRRRRRRGLGRRGLDLAPLARPRTPFVGTGRVVTRRIRIIAVVRLGRRPDDNASGGVIAPFAVTAAPAEVSWDPTTLRKRAQAGTGEAATRATPGDQNTTTLDEYGVNVRRALGPDLVGSDGSRDEGHVNPRQGQQRASWRRVDVGVQLLTAHYQERVLPRLGRGKGCIVGVVQHQGPQTGVSQNSRTDIERKIQVLT